MQFGRANAAAIGCAYHHWAGEGTGAAKTHARRLCHQLAHAEIDETGKLNLRNWPQSIDRYAHGAADYAQLRQGSIKDAPIAEFLLQVLRDAEDAAIESYVLAEEDDTLVAFKLLCQTAIERLYHRHLHTVSILISFSVRKG